MHYCKNCARFIPLRATENTLKKNASYQCDPGTMAHDNFAKIAEYSAFADDERLVPKGVNKCYAGVHPQAGGDLLHPP